MDNDTIRLAVGLHLGVPCADLTHAFIVGVMLMLRGLMVLVVGTARVATFVMLL